jgi:DnaK suppressor protein
MVEKQDEMRSLLLKMKEEAFEEVGKVVKSGSDKTGDEPSGDIYDQASNERDRELLLLLGDREREKIRNIDEALARLDEGEYGICEECEEEIPIGRLKAMPFARLCVKCKADLEKLQAQTKRFEEDRVYREIGASEEEEP